MFRISGSSSLLDGCDDPEILRYENLKSVPQVLTSDTLNLWLEERCKALWTETAHGSLPGSIADVWEAEKPALMPLPTAFDGYVEQSKRVSPTCLITFDRNRYSVPASFANRPVSLHIYPERLVIVAEGHVVCEHQRIIERSHRQPGRVIYDWRHYLAVVQRKPGALRNGAPFVEMPEAFRQLQGQMLRKPGGDREMVEILSLVLHHDEQAVLCAVEMALEAGVPTKTHVLNLLHRLVDGVNGGIKSGHWAAQKPATLGLGVTRAPRRAHSDTSDQVFRRHMISHSGVSDHPEMTPSGAVW